MLKLTMNEFSASVVFVSVASIDAIRDFSDGSIVHANGCSFHVKESADQVLAMLEAAIEDDDPDATRQ